MYTGTACLGIYIQFPDGTSKDEIEKAEQELQTEIEILQGKLQSKYQDTTAHVRVRIG